MELLEYYEQTWKAREKLLAAAEPLTPEQWSREFDFSWRSLQLLFAHIIEVERSWMLDDIRRERVPYPKPEEMRAIHSDPAASRARGRETAGITRSVLEEYRSPGKLRETREVGGADGSRVHLTIEEILIHVFTHELRHQGQLQAMFRLLGAKPPNADWF